MRQAMFFFTILFLFFSILIVAFAEECEDSVYSTDDSIIFGIITERTLDISLKTETETSDSYLQYNDDTDKASKKSIENTSVIDTKNQNTSGKIDRFGFLGYSKTGYLFHVGSGKGGGIFTLGGVSGIGLGPIFVGVGAELGFGSARWTEIRFYPIYGEIKVFFMPKSHFTPTGYFDAGVQISGLPDGWFSDEHGNHYYFEGPSTTGFLIGGGGGIEYRAFSHLGFDCSVGYRGFRWFESWCNHIGSTVGISF